MNGEVKQATREDLDKIMQLLTEYTNKLRGICEEKEESRFRRTQMLSMSMGVMMAVLMSIALLAMQDPFSLGFGTSTMPIIIMTAGIVLSVFFFLTTTMTSRRMQYSFQAKQIALTVEKLISLASQYSEHSTKNISDKFEFDLRVAEAEAALHMYKDIFGEDDHVKSQAS